MNPTTTDSITPEQFCAFVKGMFSFHDAGQVGKKTPIPAKFNEALTAMIREQLGRVQSPVSTTPATT